LRRQYAHFDETCDLVAHTFDIAASPPSSVPPLERGHGWALTTVFVTYPGEHDTVAATIGLARALPRHVPIVVVTTGQTGTVTLPDMIYSDLNYPNVKTFGLLDHVCQPEVFVNNLTEQIAQALHKSYLEDCKEHGTFDANNPAHQAWGNLDETYLEANRNQAMGYGVWLRGAGYFVEVTDTWDVTLPHFTDDEVESMARKEHGRWCEERTADGWVYGAVRDNPLKRHPDLKPWEELSEQSKDKDRDTVRAMPEILARYGLAIVRSPLEHLAMEIHRDYARQRKEQGLDPNDASLAAWRDLPETLRASNRSQASDIYRKVTAIGYEMYPAPARDVPETAFNDDEVERLAKMEHDRWFQERVSDGWTFGEQRDAQKKRSPYLVPWEQLSDDVRDLDRNTVRKIPTFAAQAGFVMRRAGSE
jgi:hypothetical protein